MNDHVGRAKSILEQILYITIATCSQTGKPWNSPVYSAYDEHYNFYWASWKENQHSKNIAENNSIFIVVYDSTVPADTGEGVYIQAKAYELSEKEEIKRALAYMYTRTKKNPQKRKPEEFLGDNPRRVYRAIPEKVWMNQVGEINGKYIDKRIEIKL